MLPRDQTSGGRAKTDVYVRGLKRRERIEMDALGALNAVRLIGINMVSQLRRHTVRAVPASRGHCRRQAGIQEGAMLLRVRGDSHR
jgi:hypothetical protein